ncbi:MAG TPA: hypothetical protein VLC95_07010 [Anaerolineae bacterium]|nr:hypothetical protein [Anaerolineae bacterium]
MTAFRLPSQSRLASVALAIALLAALLHFPRQIDVFVRPIMPVVRLWFTPDAQHRAHLGDIPYDLLQAANALLPRDATVLLVTSGTDVRRFEYITFHRALYYLAPRPVWWLSPAPSDGSWEARWWIPAPLTPDAVRTVARYKGATHLLAVALDRDLAPGRHLATWDGGYLAVLDSEPSAAPPVTVPNSPLLYRLAMTPLALAVIFVWGHAFLVASSRRRPRPGRIEAAALAWILGCGLVSLAMLALNAIGLSLGTQIRMLTLPAAAYALYSLARGATRASVPLGVRLRRLASGPRIPSLLSACLAAFLALQVLLFVAVVAVGQPLYAWDSWTSWGLKARTILLEGRISPAVYADPSRASTILYYPLSVSLIEAWIYGWIGAPDDRLVGVTTLFYYLGLAGVCYAAVRRRGASGTFALAVAAVVASMPQLALLAGIVFADLPLAALMAVAAVYLLEWIDDGSPAALTIAALAAGLLPWTKREGLLLLAALATATLVATWWVHAGDRGARLRRAWHAIGACLLAAALLAGPWWLFIGRQGVMADSSDFLPLTLDTLRANVARLPFVLSEVGKNLLRIDWSFVWPLALLVAVWPWRPTLSLARRTRRRLSAMLPITAGLYLGVMTAGYLFSSFVPFQAHFASTFYRLAAHVVPLVVLWVAYVALDRQDASP